MTQGRIYHFSSRGIYDIDKSTGALAQLIRGADRESLGGEMIVTPNALLTISNLAITAYPLRGERADLEQKAGRLTPGSNDKGVVND